MGLSVIASSSLAADPAVPEFKSYEIVFGSPSKMLELVSALIGTNGKAFYDAPTRRLMVVAPSNVHDQVSGIVRQLEVPPRNVRIEVRYRGQGTQTAKGASVSGSGQVVLGPGSGRTHVVLKPQVSDTSIETSSSTAQQILVASGRQASIFVGESVPHLEWIMDYGLRAGIFAERTEWQKVGATLVVEPYVIGDGPMIRVRLTPELSGLVGGNPRRTRLTQLATEVVVTEGVPFRLGGLSENKDFYSRFLVGVDRRGNSQSLDIELVAHIVSAR